MKVGQADLFHCGGSFYEFRNGARVAPSGLLKRILMQPSIHTIFIRYLLRPGVVDEKYWTGALDSNTITIEVVEKKGILK